MRIVVMVTVLPAVILVMLTFQPLMELHVWTAFRQMPTFLTGLAFGIPLTLGMISSKQKLVLEVYGEVNHSEFSSSTVVDTFTRAFPVDGWLTKYNVKILTESWDLGDIGYAMGFTRKSESDDTQVGTGGHTMADYTDALAASDTVSGFYSTSRPLIGVCQNDYTVAEMIHHEDGLMYLLKSGEQIDFRAAFADLGTAPTSGQLAYHVSAVFVIISYSGRSKKSGRRNPLFLTIISGFNSTTDKISTWIPNAGCRLFAIRMSVYLSNTNPGADYIQFRRYGTTTEDAAVTNYIDSLKINPDFNNVLEIRIPYDTDANDDMESKTFTLFEKGPIFCNKSEPWNLVDGLQAINNVIVLQAQVLYNYKSAWDEAIMYSATPSNSAYYRYYYFKQDMYVTQIENDITITDAGASFDGHLHFFMFKPGYVVEDRTGKGHIFMSDNTGTGILSPALIDTITCAAASTKYKDTSLEIINDYFPAGSTLMVLVDDLAEVDSIDIMTKIEGRIPVKQGKSDVLQSHYRGSHVMDVRSMEVMRA
jgi:hypothetical protein